MTNPEDLQEWWAVKGSVSPPVLIRHELLRPPVNLYFSSTKIGAWEIFRDRRRKTVAQALIEAEEAVSDVSCASAELIKLRVTRHES